MIRKLSILNIAFKQKACCKQNTTTAQINSNPTTSTPTTTTESLATTTVAECGFGKIKNSVGECIDCTGAVQNPLPGEECS